MNPSNNANRCRGASIFVVRRYLFMEVLRALWARQFVLTKLSLFVRTRFFFAFQRLPGTTLQGLGPHPLGAFRRRIGSWWFGHVYANGALAICTTCELAWTISCWLRSGPARVTDGPPRAERVLGSRPGWGPNHAHQQTRHCHIHIYKPAVF